MKLVLLGTTGYHPNDERQTACFMLPEQGIVLDAGTAMYRVRDQLVTPELDIFLTHAHLDHIVGLTFLFDVIYDKPMGDSQEPYYKILLENALITSIQNSGSHENPVESISFAYSKIKVSYNPEEDGALKGFIDKGFDVLKLKPW